MKRRKRIKLEERNLGSFTESFQVAQCMREMVLLERSELVI